jgi:hypothetical protein
MRPLANDESSGLLTFGVVGALWSSPAVLVSIVGTLNRAYGVDKGRPWWKVRLIAIGSRSCGSNRPGPRRRLSSPVDARSYGPLLLNRMLLPYVEAMELTLGWGWRHFIFRTDDRRTSGHIGCGNSARTCSLDSLARRVHGTAFASGGSSPLRFLR